MKAIGNRHLRVMPPRGPHISSQGKVADRAAVFAARRLTDRGAVATATRFRVRTECGNVLDAVTVGTMPDDGVFLIGILVPSAGAVNEFARAFCDLVRRDVMYRTTDVWHLVWDHLVQDIGGRQRTDAELRGGAGRAGGVPAVVPGHESTQCAAGAVPLAISGHEKNLNAASALPHVTAASECTQGIAGDVPRMTAASECTQGIANAVPPQAAPDTAADERAWECETEEEGWMLATISLGFPGEEKFLAVRDSTLAAMDPARELRWLRDACRVTGLGLLRVHQTAACHWEIQPG